MLLFPHTFTQLSQKNSEKQKALPLYYITSKILINAFDRLIFWLHVANSLNFRVILVFIVYLSVCFYILFLKKNFQRPKIYFCPFHLSAK